MNTTAPSSSAAEAGSPRVFRFGKGQAVSVAVRQVMEADYGLYVWPSALILSEFIVAHPSLFAGAHVIELGAGTGVAGLVAAKQGAAASVLLTDRADAAHVLENLMHNANINANATNKTKVRVMGLSWGMFDCNLVKEMLSLGRTAAAATHPVVVLGADCLYDPHQFEDLFATVHALLRLAPTMAVFYTTYQHRSGNRSIKRLLDRWSMQARSIPLDSFLSSPPPHQEIYLLAISLRPPSSSSSCSPSDKHISH
ncbi:Methyltransferase-like protein 23 [Balamuthia mandrillaris]